VDKANGGLQFPDLPVLVAAEAQNTVTAEMGIAGQLLKPGEPACTVKLQLPAFPTRLCQLTHAPAFPKSTGAESGLVAVKVMVAGLTLRLKSPAAGRACAVSGFACAVGGRGAAGRPAAANNAVTDSQTTIGF
jgi:hypothetical protein